MTARLTALALVLLVVLCGEASAADPFWHTSYPSTDGFSLNDVSCGSPIFCVAVGGSGEAVVQDGTYQYETRPESVPSFNAVSCAPASRFCMAVDNQGNAVSFANGEFGGPDNIDGDVEFQSVSCPTPTFCMAVDHLDVAWKYADGGWNSTTLTKPAGFAEGSSRVACASASSCVAVARGTAGIASVKYTSGTWSTSLQSLGTAAEALPKSLTCTSPSFCLVTSSTGSASRYDGTNWSTKSVATSQLWSGCAGTTCHAIDQNVKAYDTSNGVDWSAGTNIKPSTLFGAPSAVTCIAADLCVSTSTSLTTTFARSIIPTVHPVLSGPATVGSTLTVKHAPVAEIRAWYVDQWLRCDNPGSTCVRIPDVNASTYKLTAADLGKYVEARDVTGVGLDEEGATSATSAFVSNSIHVTAPAASPPPSPSPSPQPSASPSPSPSPTATVKPKAPKLSGKPKTTKKATTIKLKCSGAKRCKGKVTLRLKKKRVGSARYSIAAGTAKRVKVTLGKAARKALKKHHKLKVTLTLAPTGGKAVKQTVTLRR